MEHYDSGSRNQTLDNKASLQAREAYEIGYELVVKKVQRAHERYNKMILSFCHFQLRKYASSVGT